MSFRDSKLAQEIKTRPNGFTTNQVKECWWLDFGESRFRTNQTHLIRQHGSPGPLQVVVGVDTEGWDIQGMSGRHLESCDVQCGLLLIYELGQDEGSGVRVQRTIQMGESVPLYACQRKTEEFLSFLMLIEASLVSFSAAQESCWYRPGQPVSPQELQ